MLAILPSLNGKENLIDEEMYNHSQCVFVTKFRLLRLPVCFKEVSVKEL